jgi:hypothetical protein
MQSARHLVSPCEHPPIVSNKGQQTSQANTFSCRGGVAWSSQAPQQPHARNKAYMQTYQSSSCRRMQTYCVYPATVNRARSSATSCEDWDLIFEWLGEEKRWDSNGRAKRKKKLMPFSISVIWYLSLPLPPPKSKKGTITSRREKAPAPCTSVPTSQKKPPRS